MHIYIYRYVDAIEAQRPKQIVGSRAIATSATLDEDRIAKVDLTVPSQVDLPYSPNTPCTPNPKP